MSIRMKLILLAIAAVLATIFILQNMITVEIPVFFWTITMSRSLLMVILLAIGLAIGWFLNSYFLHLRKKRGG